MKNKKGFTLVEILAVIVLMGILLGFAVPSVINISKKQKANLKEQKIEIIVDAAEEYLKDNKDAYYTLKDDYTLNGEYFQSDGENIYIPIKNLQDKGYVDDISDPESENSYIIDKVYVKIDTTATGHKVYKTSKDKIN